MKFKMSKEKKIAVVCPCFNESHTVIKFLDLIEKTYLQDTALDIVVVNDASTDNTLQLLKSYKFKSELFDLKILNLKYNQGHQKAIYNGLSYSYNNGYKKVIVMDSDGEDDPRAINELVDKSREFSVIHVGRKSRSENLKFKLLYFLYRFLFKLLTNKKMNFGNYSMIDRSVLFAVVNEGYIHYCLLYTSDAADD